TPQEGPAYPGRPGGWAGRRRGSVPGGRDTDRTPALPLRSPRLQALLPGVYPRGTTLGVVRPEPSESPPSRRDVRENEADGGRRRFRGGGDRGAQCRTPPRRAVRRFPGAVEGALLRQLPAEPGGAVRLFLHRPLRVAAADRGDPAALPERRYPLERGRPRACGRGDLRVAVQSRRRTADGRQARPLHSIAS